MALVVETHQNTGGSGGNSSLGGVRRSGVDHVMFALPKIPKHTTSGIRWWSPTQLLTGRRVA